MALLIRHPHSPQPLYPYSLSQLRADEPTRSFSMAPSPQDLEELGCYYVTSTPAPMFNPFTQRVEELLPVLIDGEYVQQWRTITLTQEEQDAYVASLPPEWVAFGAEVVREPSVNALLLSAFQTAPGLYGSLTVGLGKAADGDARVFWGAWRDAHALGLVSQPLIQQLQALAASHRLPAEFVAALNPGTQP